MITKLFSFKFNYFRSIQKNDLVKVREKNNLIETNKVGEPYLLIPPKKANPANNESTRPIAHSPRHLSYKITFT